MILLRSRNFERKPKTIQSFETDDARKLFDPVLIFRRWYSNAFLWFFSFLIKFKRISVRNHIERFIFTVFVQQDLRGSNNKVNLSGAFGTHTSAISFVKCHHFRKYKIGVIRLRNLEPPRNSRFSRICYFKLNIISL